jgi:hypothetical protein
LDAEGFHIAVIHQPALGNGGVALCIARYLVNVCLAFLCSWGKWITFAFSSRLNNRPMKKILALFFVSFTFCYASAQTMFFKKFNNLSLSNSAFPNLYEAKQTFDGGYIIVANDTALPSKAILIKTNSVGDTLWTKGYRPSFFPVPLSVVQTDDSGYIAVGTNGFVLRTDANGDTVWVKRYVYTSGKDWNRIIRTMDGKFVVSALGFSSGGGDDLAFMKIDSLGSIQWARMYVNTNGSEKSRAIEQTSDSGFVIAGWRGNIDPPAMLVKTNSLGLIQWSKQYYSGAGTENYIVSVKPTLDGGYILCGYTKTLNYSILLIKTDSAGDTVWTRTYRGPNDDYGYSVIQLSDGSYVVAGRQYTADANQYDVSLMKLDNTGNILWSRCYGGGLQSLEAGTSVQQTTDGGFIIPGYTFTTFNFYGGLQLIKTDASGNTACNQRVSTLQIYPQTFQVSTFNISAPSTLTGSNIPAVVSSGGRDSTVCLITEIQEARKQNDIEVYPNPNNGTFTISLGDRLSTFSTQLFIYDVTGRKVYQQLLSRKQETVSYKLSRGIYLLRVTDGARTFIEKLVAE